jgi:hypothetical protein
VRHLGTWLAVAAVWINPTAPAVLADAAGQDLSVVRYPAPMPPASPVPLRVRVENTGSEPLIRCRVVHGSIVSDGACVVLGYRFWRAPKRLNIRSVDTVALLAPGEVLAPGASVERTVQLRSPRWPPRHGGEVVVHIFLARGRGDALHWSHATAPVSLGTVPTGVWLREWMTRLLFVSYILGLTWALWRALRRNTSELPACSC